MKEQKVNKKSNKQLPRIFFASVAIWLVSLLVQAALAADMAVPATASATGTSEQPVVVTLTQFKLGQDEKGELQFLDASVVKPGDVLEYRASYKNQSSSTLSVVATLPVPEELEYLPDSASVRSAGSRLFGHTVALKDWQFATEPLMRSNTSADGSKVSYAVPYAEYRYVRWQLDALAPGAAVEVSLRARVSQTVDPSAGAAR